jgi:HEPN domain-containing protein
MVRDSHDRWLERADYDLGTAEAMLASGRFISQYYMSSRYKEDLQDLLQQVGEETARQFVDFARERMAWLTRKIRP